MCGIAGIFNLNHQSVNIETLKIFTDSMAHRGPDGAGYEILNNGTLGFGHRRLAILDLTDAGNQPFHYLNRYTIVYNGEIFNFNDIKTELKEKGYNFHSDTDTEVLIAAFDCYGLKCFDKFNGMWAFAIWDNQTQKLTLCRDRFGVKPLYYSHTLENSFVFASETRAFKFLNGFKRKIDNNNYKINLDNNYAIEGLGYTIFENIYQLLPGHYIEITTNNCLQQKRWYDISEKLIENKDSFEAQTKTFYSLFRDACRIRLISDVPVATALSGGLDSSSIYSTVFDILKTENNKRINTNSQLAVSAVFPDLTNDEKIYVEKAIQYTNGAIEWVTTDTVNLIENIERETELFDAISNSPICSISAIYKGMKKAGITVSLDGHGVDEMLYGYLYMVYDLFINALNDHNKNLAIDLSKTLALLYHPDEQKKQIEILNNSINYTFNFKNKFKHILKKIIGRLKINSNSYFPISLKSLSDKPYNFEKNTFNQRILLFDFFQNSLPSLLRNFDRAGMMNSVEIRMPFLDYRLVEFVFSLPTSSKIANGFTKYILREAMLGKMNEEVRLRTFKVGITSPFENWAQNELKDWLYLQINKLDEVESNIYTKLLDQYYTSLEKKHLEDVWQRINLELIK